MHVHIFVRTMCIIIVLASATADAETLATCGASKGHGYFVPKGAVTKEDFGWVEDGISAGSFQLIRAGDDFDIIYTDARGTVSSKGDGGSIAGFITDAGDVVVQVIYEVSFETYIFWLSLKEPVVSFSQAKFAATIPKHSLMVAKCRRGAG